MKRFIFGFLWVVVFYVGSCVVVGAVAGAIAGANHPDHAAAAGTKAGAEAVEAIRIFLALGAIALGVVGAWLRWLPGTRLD